jgi:hypothetical protein
MQEPPMHHVRLNRECKEMTMATFFHPTRTRALAATAILLLTALSPHRLARVTAVAGPTIVTGNLGGAAYKIEMPARWNGTLLLYSHGYQGSPHPILKGVAPDPLTAAWLLAHGYALAGSSYSSTGWAVAQALHDQLALLDYFGHRFGSPRRTISWGESLGGLISAGLVQQFPTRFAGALPMCGLLGGGVGTFNQGLDAAFAFKTLLAPHAPLRLVHITDPNANQHLAEQILARAQRTTQGRARLALAAALIDLPGWYDPTSREPAPTDVDARVANQVAWVRQVGLPFGFGYPHAEIEQRAGGNPSWNTGVSYRTQVARSIDRDEVQALYRQAGLSLEADLRTLDRAPRIAADPRAVAYLARYVTLTGRLQVPVLTLHTTGDGFVPADNEQAYASAARTAGNGRLLRQLFVHRAGHCAFTSAEIITAFRALMQRVETGRWGHVETWQALNRQALALGSGVNVLDPEFIQRSEAPLPTTPAFVAYQPPPYLRPFASGSRAP